MKLKKTSITRAILVMTVLSLGAVGIFTQTSLFAQDTKPEFKPTKDTWRQVYTFIARNRLTPRHERIMSKVQNMYPDKALAFEYSRSNAILEHTEAFRNHAETLYFDKVEQDDREILIQKSMDEFKPELVERLGLDLKSKEFAENVKLHVNNEMQYLYIYEKKGVWYEAMYEEAIDENEVDQLPQPLGGIDNFVKGVALDTEIPEGLSKSQLPETIDFSVVVKGGRQISGLNVLTDITLAGKEKKKVDELIGQVHKNILRKVATQCYWKKGVKDGQQVNVRMTISIPTAYM